MNGTVLRQKAAEKANQADSVLEAALTEGRALTESELTTRTTLLSEVEQLRRTAELADQRATQQVETEQKSLQRPPVTGRLMIEDDPSRGFRTPREFFTLVMNAGIGQVAEDDRLRYLSVKRLTAGTDGHSGAHDAHGGYLVPVAFAPVLEALPLEDDPTAGTTQIPMQASKVDVPARVDKDHRNSVSGGLRVYRRSETQAVEASRLQLELIRFSAESLMGISFCTEELIQDSPQTVIALITQGYQQEFAARLVNEKLHGTGVGEYLGVLAAPCLITVPAEGGQAVDTIVFDNVIRMRARCYDYGNAVWIANHDTYPQLARLHLVIGTSGVAMWQDSLMADRPPLLCGRPIVFSEFASAIGDVGDLILASWRHYGEGSWQPLQSAESLHVRFVNNERAFRFTMRNDGKPLWSTTLLPKKGAQTLSPFITLAAR